MNPLQWIKHLWRLLCRLIGIVLVLGGLLAAYGWFYKLGPARHICDPHWYNTHSLPVFWAETQKSLRRGLWFHDDAFAIGTYGDKVWMAWIVKRVKPGDTLHGCLDAHPQHGDIALTHISNQDAGPKADDWMAWWQKNKTKTQVEWIQDGFKLRGFAIDAPPKPEQVPVLLGILGDTDTNTTTKIPAYMKYNAFRFLRDGGFEPVDYALSNSTASIEIQRGLLQYDKRLREHPAALELGLLSFGQQTKKGTNLPIPYMLTFKFQAIAYALIFVPLLLGGGLLIQSFRRKKNLTTPPP